LGFFLVGGRERRSGYGAMKLEVANAEHRESIVPAVHFGRSTVINVEEEKVCSGGQ
jgi:hypothetical protein